jgi:Leucine-rich repeat (LRR) protein
MDEEYVSKVGAGLQSFRILIPEVKTENVRSLCLHGNEISTLDGLEQFTNLVDLNLSANALSEMEGLQNLRNLRSLNLASNRIQHISGMQGMSQLESLNLAHNFITSLSGLAALQVRCPYAISTRFSSTTKFSQRQHQRRYQ